MPGARRRTPRIAWLGVVPFACAALLILSARWFWLGDLAAGVAWQLGCVELAGAALLALLRAWRPAGALLLLAALHTVPELKLWWPTSGSGAADAPTLTVASHNLLAGNGDHDAFEAWLDGSSADVVVLSEVSWRWRAVLDGLTDYPHRLYSPGEDAWNRGTWGTAILSRTPFASTRLIEPAEENWRPPMEARLTFAGRTITVRGAHALRPGKNPLYIRRRNATLRRLAEQPWDELGVLAGDLNVTSTVPVFGELLARSGLRDTRCGFGRQPTFVTSPRTGSLEVAIDHVLVGDAFRVLDRRTERVPGSDHRAVVAVLALAGGYSDSQSASNRAAE